MRKIGLKTYEKHQILYILYSPHVAGLLLPPSVWQNARDLVSEESKAQGLWTEGNIHTEEIGDPLLQRGEFSKLCIMTAETSQIDFCTGSQDYGHPVLTLQARGCMNLLWEFSLVQIPTSTSGISSSAAARLLTHVPFFVIPWTVACQAPLSMGFPRQKYWSELPFHCPQQLDDPKAKDIKENSAQCPKLSIIFTRSHSYMKTTRDGQRSWEILKIDTKRHKQRKTT